MHLGVRHVLTAAVLLGLAEVSFSADRQEPRSSVREEARVVLVEVPVNVLGKEGRPVEKLTAEDFEIYDDGKRQEITGFEILDQRQPVSVPKPGEPPINPAAQRHFLLVFDLSFGSPRGIVSARKSARDFVLTRMKELDLAAVATYSVENGMRLLVTFTRDRTQLAAAIDTLGLPNLADRMSDPLGFFITPPTTAIPSGFGFFGNARGSNPETGLDLAVAEAVENELLRARSLRAIYRDRVSRFLESFAQLAKTLDVVQGRKHILYLSEGFDSRELSGATSKGAGAQEAEWTIRGQSWRVDNDTRFGNTELRSGMLKALALFNRSDCVIHAIDIGGLRAGPEIPGNELSSHGRDSLAAIAAQTGGEFLQNANELGPAFEKLLDRTGLIYILAFQPVRVPETGKFHTLKVRVKNKPYKVSHRTGYYEAKKYAELTPLEKKLATAHAIAAAVPKTDIPAWVLAAPFPAGPSPARIPVIVEIPGDRLLANHGEPTMNVDLFVYAIDAKGETRDYLYQPIAVEIAKARQTLENGGLKYYGTLSLPSGKYTLRVLVRNNETGRFGVSLNALTVPTQVSEDPFTLPPLFLEEDKQWIMVRGRPGASSKSPESAEYPFSIGGESFVPAALADLKSGEETRVCLIAYNFPPGPVSLGFSGSILSVDGQPRGRVELELLKASDREPEGVLKLLFRFKPSGLDPGRYALSLRLKDPRNGKTSESSFPFDVQ